MRLTKLKNEILSFFFPTKCACCQKIILPSEEICISCKEKLEFIQEKRCLKCGMGENFCECRFNVFRFEGIAAPFYNTGAIQKGIYNLKFRGHVSAQDFFIKQMCLAADKYFTHISFDAVTFVPPSEKRISEHGYNQSEILAKGVARHLKVPVLNLLKRVGKSKTQHEIGKYKERFENVRGIYVAQGKLSPETVLLVDDIKTTGATLNECARRLKLGGVKNVYCLTAAVTNPRLKKPEI